MPFKVSVFLLHLLLASTCLGRAGSYFFGLAVSSGVFMGERQDFVQGVTYKTNDAYSKMMPPTIGAQITLGHIYRWVLTQIHAGASTFKQVFYNDLANQEFVSIVQQLGHAGVMVKLGNFNPIGFQVYLMAGAEACFFTTEYIEPERKPEIYKNNSHHFKPGILLGAGFQRPYYHTILSVNYVYSYYGNVSNIFYDPENHRITQNFRNLCAHAITIGFYFTF